MKLKLVKSDHMTDWYTIERAEHNGAQGLAPIAGGFRFVDSARIGDACVEGDLHEMAEIAKAIRARGLRAFKRCAVNARSEPVSFWSPRNTIDAGDGASYAEADELAEQIERAVADAAEAARRDE